MRLIIQIILLIVYPIIILPLPILFGFIAVPYMYRLRNVDYADLPKWTRPWSNLEDWTGQPGTYVGSLPKWYVRKHIGMGSDWMFAGTWTRFKFFVRYHALRNSADGLRSFALFAVKMDSNKVHYRTPHYFLEYTPAAAKAAGLKTICYFCWQGFKAGFKIIHIWNDTHHFELKFGWRITPADQFVDGRRSLTPRERFLKDHLAFTTKFPGLGYRKT